VSEKSIFILESNFIEYCRDIFSGWSSDGFGDPSLMLLQGGGDLSSVALVGSIIIDFFFSSRLLEQMLPMLLLLLLLLLLFMLNIRKEQAERDRCFDFRISYF
jgi:hypothetical protein